MSRTMNMTYASAILNNLYREDLIDELAEQDEKGVRTVTAAANAPLASTSTTSSSETTTAEEQKPPPTSQKVKFLTREFLQPGQTRKIGSGRTIGFTKRTRTTSGSFDKNRYGVSKLERDNANLWLQITTKTFGFACDTYFFAVNVMDRFLSKIKVTSNPRQLQLIVAACFWISCKYLEESENVPRLKDVIIFSGNQFRHNDMTRMETIILGKLKYELYTVTCIDFLVTFVSTFKKTISSSTDVKPDVNEIVGQCVKLLIVSSGYDFLEYYPSTLALMALFITLQESLEADVFDQVFSRNSVFYISMDEDFYCCVGEMKYVLEKFV